MNKIANIRHIVSTIFLFAILFSACSEFETVSSVPEINFISFDVIARYDTTLGREFKVGELEFDFIDGDADLGVYPEVSADTLLPDSVRKNLFINIYEKIDGTYAIKHFTQWNDATKQFDTNYLHQSITYNSKLDRVGQNKTIKGIIRSDIETAYFENSTDTFRIEFYIRDRALNKSNVENTQDYFIK